MVCQIPIQIHRAVVNKMIETKTSFKTKLCGVNAAYLKGNDFWFEDYGDYNLHVDFHWNGDRFFLIEYTGYTQSGASWSCTKIFKYGSNEVVYSDSYHDGRGAWPHDGDSAKCQYSDLTEYILKVFKSYIT